MKFTKVLIIHGPNLGLLGKREPEIYGKTTLAQINMSLKKSAKKKKIKLTIKQSDLEGKIVELIGRAPKNYDALIINPAAYTHTSVAIRDAISACGLPVIEVHLSNIYTREKFRRHSLISPVVYGQICGFGMNSYLLGLDAIVELLHSKR